VTAFYMTDHLSALSLQEILTLMREFHEADLRRRKRLAVLQGNGSLKLFKMSLTRIRQKQDFKSEESI
jgi:hypothetical protein